ncbi:hypothetical protein CERSUDRAFT_116310 [Gelatoporia subvermispora B]|uniref:Transmembrane protein n=1 Tax=Ceriporiopsis subvermispora (strain B) TaxID=914234 RepID=M2QEU8_CERS8|nr:hypothetical protein CERSUDRAFT_116310 [Gelatoporia subvermispora B]
MVDWSSQAEILVDATAFMKLMHSLAGLYFWDFASSLDFEWAFITRKKKFTWPLIFYFAGRYCLFFALIGILIALDTTSEVNCQALYTFNQLAGDAAVGLASINLSIRTMAIWSQSRWIVGPLVIVILGHWALILQGVLLKAEWVPGSGCAITHTNNTILAATFIYSMCFDALIFTLSAWKLAFKRAGTRSQLMKMLFKDGLIYFLVAFGANLLATIFMLLNWNSIMSVIFNVPAAVASTIVASRAVRRLNKFTTNGPEMLTTSATHSGLAFRTGQHPTISRNIGVPMQKDLSGGVHVQMQTFTVAEEEDQHSDWTQDGESRKKVEDPEICDAEISADFKRPPY